MKYSFKNSIRWSVFIFILTFFLASVFSVTSTTVLAGVSWGIGMIVVLLIVLCGIFFDMIGLASAAADEIPFHAMASERVDGSKQAILIVRNADRFSNFCNDVIGDICGIISGTASALVVLKLTSSADGPVQTAISVAVAGLVSGLTVGGKALGKSFAISHATHIVLLIGRLFYVLEHRLGIRVLQSKKKKSNNGGKRGKQRAARTNSET
ncbi:hypothetical protein [Paenibacillus turpanensis]|uniref:hypothetical protein n=1 Tax=Paenibacillus turpanensis TaxID=2689078 RepID=UPI001409DFBB|nr:hypothetical protein [Paenibacillus turpanensis]